MKDEDVDHINTIYCTLNHNPQENGSEQLYIRPNIQHHDKGLTSDNIRIKFFGMDDVSYIIIPLIINVDLIADLFIFIAGRACIVLIIVQKSSR